MSDISQPIDLDLTTQLRDKSFRQKFFLAESSALIAQQLVSLRKRRELNQKQVAELIGTQQPAISRVERADYQSWSFTTLRSIADALDARIRVYIEPAEDVLREYAVPPIEIPKPTPLASVLEQKNRSGEYGDFKGGNAGVDYELMDSLLNGFRDLHTKFSNPAPSPSTADTTNVVDLMSFRESSGNRSRVKTAFDIETSMRKRAQL